MIADIAAAAGVVMTEPDRKPSNVDGWLRRS